MTTDMTPTDFGGDYSQHPLSRTVYTPPASQPAPTCVECGWWTMDTRYIVPAVIDGQPVHVCADRADCQARQARKARELVSA